LKHHTKYVTRCGVFTNVISRAVKMLGATRD